MTDFIQRARSGALTRIDTLFDLGNALSPIADEEPLHAHHFFLFVCLVSFLRTVKFLLWKLRRWATLPGVTTFTLNMQWIRKEVNKTWSLLFSSHSLEIDVDEQDSNDEDEYDEYEDDVENINAIDENRLFSHLGLPEYEYVDADNYDHMLPNHLTYGKEQTVKVHNPKVISRETRCSLVAVLVLSSLFLCSHCPWAKVQH